MNSNIRKAVTTLLTVIVSGILGCIIGIITISPPLSLFYTSSTAEDTTALILNINALEHLHGGEPKETIDLLELELDRQIMKYSLNVKRTEQEQQDINRALRRAKEYRSKYPRVTKYPDLDQTVKKTLSQVENEGYEPRGHP